MGRWSDIRFARWLLLLSVVLAGGLARAEPLTREQIAQQRAGGRTDFSNLEAPGANLAGMVRGMKSMPAFPELDDEQIVALTNYLRTSYGNSYTDPVTLAQVKELRPTAVVRRRGRAG